jgi:chorismate--pyruvate lyase
MARIRVGSHRGEPVWQPALRKHQKIIPAGLISWIFDTPSLTQRIQRLCNGNFKVRVLSQEWQRPMFNERLMLGMRDGEYGMVRQVQLLCNRQPWVFARTVIPVRTLSGAQRRLAHLGDKPLGALLFADKSVRRGRMQVAHITPGQAIYDIATKDLRTSPAAIWGRRSVFYRNAKPLLVSEIFLPMAGHEACRV